MPKFTKGFIPDHIVQIMASTETHTVLAERFGLSYYDVAKIRRSKRYQHLKPLRHV